MGYMEYFRTIFFFCGFEDRCEEEEVGFMVEKTMVLNKADIEIVDRNLSSLRQLNPEVLVRVSRKSRISESAAYHVYLEARTIEDLKPVVSEIQKLIKTHSLQNSVSELNKSNLEMFERLEEGKTI